MHPVDVQHTRPVWAEISAHTLQANYRALRAAAGNQVSVLAVIKANAYGHGAAECAPVLAAAGAPWLGVTSVEEGVAVRRALGILPETISPRILVMCGVWPGEQAACLDRQLTPVVWEPYHLDLLEQEARIRRMPTASLAVHVEIDTGMARQGVAPGPLLARLLQRFVQNPLRLEGVMTHMASAECIRSPQNEAQRERFAAALAQVCASGLRPSLVHVGNTSGVDSGAAAAWLPALAQGCGAQAMSRAGLALYGYALPLEDAGSMANAESMAGAEPPADAESPMDPHQPLSPHQAHLANHLAPVMTWKTRVVSLREVEAGATVGYNGTFVASHAMRLALLPVGYADGFRRALSSSTGKAGGAVLVRGMRAPVIGRVSMDLTVVDVSHLPDVAIGEEAVLIGGAASLTLSAAEHAGLARTSVYEVLCGISDRVPRQVVA